MKRFLSPIVFVTLITFLISCRKDDTETSTAIIGDWELLSVQAGMVPTKNYPAGNGNILKYTNSDYQSFSNGQLVKSGTYTIASDPSVESETCLTLPDNEFKNRITYDNNDYNPSKIFLQIKNDTLTFLSGCFAVDAGARKKYVRMKKSYEL